MCVCLFFIYSIYSLLIPKMFHRFFSQIYFRPDVVFFYDNIKLYIYIGFDINFFIMYEWCRSTPVG